MVDPEIVREDADDEVDDVVVPELPPVLAPGEDMAGGCVTIGYDD